MIIGEMITCSEVHAAIFFLVYSALDILNVSFPAMRKGLNSQPKSDCFGWSLAFSDS
jgi:hypothetical protein